MCWWSSQGTRTRKASSSRSASLRPFHKGKKAQGRAPSADSGQAVIEPWDADIDAAWSKVRGSSIAGSKAAAEAAKVLGVSKVSASRYKNLQGLLDASELLQSRWSREGNAILRRSAPV